MARQLKYDKEFLSKNIKDSTSIREVIRKIGGCESGGTFKYIKSKISEYNIDISHFIKIGNNISRKLEKLSPNEALVRTSIRRHRSTLKRAMIEIGIDYTCSMCGIEPIQNGEYLKLQIDHINGEHNDHDPANVRFLCPNCHSQTKTQSKIKKESTKNICLCKICEKPILKNTKTDMCQQCYKLSTRTVIRPEYDILCKEIEQLGFVRVGKKYGVSDNSIRKQLKNYKKGL